MTYNEFNQRISLVKVGMTVNEVINILGPSQAKDNNKWFYNKFEGEMKPPNVGEQRFYGATLYFKNGFINKIDLAWMDVTGPQRRP